mmetsp:Transcript_15895/g.37937  ORF Transcript_15895/g.37937 Transcript_15895/m.37937 type:complete len:203 (-) Transcript_15895:292-900(-)
MHRDRRAEVAQSADGNARTSSDEAEEVTLSLCVQLGQELHQIHQRRRRAIIASVPLRVDGGGEMRRVPHVALLPHHELCELRCREHVQRRRREHVGDTVTEGVELRGDGVLGQRRHGESEVGMEVVDVHCLIGTSLAQRHLAHTPYVETKVLEGRNVGCGEVGETTCDDVGGERRVSADDVATHNAVMHPLEYAAEMRVDVV